MANDFSKVHVALGDRAYDIVIGANLDILQFLRKGRSGSSALIVTNEKVGPLYSQNLTESLRKIYDKVLGVVLPDGEVHKNWQTLNIIYDALLENG